MNSNSPSTLNYHRLPDILLVVELRRSATSGTALHSAFLICSILMRCFSWTTVPCKSPSLRQTAHHFWNVMDKGIYKHSPGGLTTSPSSSTNRLLKQHDLQMAEPSYSGRSFQGVNISDHANAILGDVYTSCSDVVHAFTPEQERRALTNILKYNGMHDRFNQVKRAAPNTCEWIWQTAFHEWLQEPSLENIFWISGKPGSGKSTLMKYLARSKKTSQILPPVTDGRKWGVVHFFFDFRAAGSLANTDEGLMRSVLFQTLDRLPLKATTLQHYQDDLKDLEQDASPEGITDLLIDIFQRDALKVLLLIDGLDECASNLRLLIQSIKRLNEASTIRICLASRDVPLLKKALIDCPRLQVHNHNKDGIVRYLKQLCLDIASDFNLELPSQTERMTRLADYLLHKSDGVWLYVYLASEMLIERIVQGFSEDEIRREMESLPDELSVMYERIFYRTPNICKAEAAFILVLVETSHGPFPIRLLYGMSLLWKQRVLNLLDSYDDIGPRQYQVRLRGLLGGLLDFCRTGTPRSLTSKTQTPVKVRLIHETLRQYIQSSDVVRQSLPSAHFELYPDHLWLRIFVEVLIESDRLLGTGSWQILEDIDWIVNNQPEVLESDLAVDSKIERAVLACLRGALEASKSPGVQINIIRDTGIFAEMIVEAIKSIHTLAIDIDLKKWNSSANLVEAISSPLLYLHDYLNLKNFRYLKYYKTSDAFSRARHDLNFAAARHWDQYLIQNSHEVAKLSNVEQDYVLKCYLERRTIIHDDAASFVWSLLSIPIEVLRPFMVGKQSNLGLAMKLCSSSQRDSSSDLSQWLNELAETDDAIVNPMLDTAAIPGAFMEMAFGGSIMQFCLERRLIGVHLVELWILLENFTYSELSTRLDLLIAHGIDIHSWWNPDGNAIVHAVLSHQYRSAYDADTISKIAILQAHNVSFYQPNSEKEIPIVACWRLHNILRRDVSPSNLESQLGLADKTDMRYTREPGYWKTKAEQMLDSFERCLELIEQQQDSGRTWRYSRFIVTPLPNADEMSRHIFWNDEKIDRNTATL